MNRVLTLLGISVLALLAIGLVTLASAGGVNGVRLYGVGQENHFIIQQLKWLVLASAVFLAATFFDYHKFRDYPWITWALYVVVVGLLALVLWRAGDRNGSKRWIKVGSHLLQPSEFAKITVIVMTAMALDRAGWCIGRFLKGVLPAFVLMAVPVGLTLKEPDFGATAVILLSGGILFWIAGVRVKHLGILVTLALPFIAWDLWKNPNRMNRILVWLPSGVFDFLGLARPTGDEANHQLDMALVAFRNGGVFGSPGFFSSKQKLAYLPEAHTDFIFAIGAEEWGLLFSLLLLALFVTLFVCGLYISSRAPDRFGRLLAFGITFLLFFQALFNLYVVTGLFPTKGIALPFISYGGTNLVSALAAVGLLFNVGRQIELQKCRPRSTLSAVCSTHEG